MAADMATEAVLAGYRLLGEVLRPFVPLILSRRADRGREDRARAGERYGKASVARPAGRLVWIHAVSVGETNVALPLIRALAADGLTVVLTTTTVTSAAIAARRLPHGAVHQFVPLDIAAFVTRFLDHWRPDLAIFVESEIWPTMIRTLDNKGVPLVLVNARLSDRSYRRWQRLAPLARNLTARIDLCLAQSERDRERFAELGAGNAVAAGNIKFDAPVLEADSAVLADLKEAFVERPVWVAASTHPGEEAEIARAHRLMVDRLPGLVTVVVPRHPERGVEIATTLRDAGLAIAVRSRDEPVETATDIYLADTLGELGVFYRLAHVAFLGGSLIPHGGQNPIEPARLGLPVLHGPHVGNFADIYETLDEATDAPVIEDAESLAAAVTSWLDRPDLAERAGAAARAVVERHRGALATTLDALRPYLETGGQDART